MKFYTLKEAPTARDDVVFKASPFAALVGVFVFLVFAVALFVLGIRGGIHGPRVHFPAPLAYWIGGLCALIALFCLASFRARLKRSNWLLRCNQSGILVKYRYYGNWRMPADDVQVVGLDYAEIAWARKTNDERTTFGLSGEKQTHWLSFLDLCLVKPDTSELQARLDAERHREWSVRVLLYPVEVLPDGIVRVSWKGCGGGRNPDAALRYLGRFVRIADPVSGRTDLTTPSITLTAEEQDARIKKLLQSGDRMGAIKLTREVYDCSLSDAVAYVEKL